MPGKKGMTGEGLGGRREGSGRKPRWFRAEKDQKMIHERQTLDTNPNFINEVWTVLSVSEKEIEFQCGNDIIVVRWPEDDD